MESPAELTEKGIKTPYGNEKWIGPTVRNILTNEKYKGRCAPSEEIYFGLI